LIGMEHTSMPRRLTGSVAALLLLTLLTTMPATPCAAQTQTLSPPVVRGEEVIVTDTDGREHRGQLLDAGADGVLLAPAEDRQVFRWSEVAEVRHRQRDSPINGLLIGLGAGLVGGVVSRHALCSLPDSECEAIVDRAIVLPVIVGGAAIGALIDNIIHKEVVVYRADRRGVGSSATVSVTPSFGPRAGGLHVAWTF
jgi:hypothetical protein